MIDENQGDDINERIPGAEPAPQWPEAKEEYQWAWELHYIGLASAYILVSLYSLIVLLILLIRRKIQPERKTMVYHYAVHSLLVLFGVTRASFLLTDPYELNMDFPLVSTRLLFGIGFPCLTSSYSLLHVGFLEICKVKLSGNKLNNKKFVVSVIMIHFLVVIVADTITALKRETALLLLVCMSFFILWGFAISVSILYSGIKVLRKSHRHESNLRSMSHYKGPRSTSTSSTTSQLFLPTTRPNRLKKTVRITLLTAVLAMSLCICNLIALVGVFRVYSGIQENSEPWEWWSFQTMFRLIEIALAVVMGYAVTPVKLWGLDMLRRDTTTYASVIPGNSQSHRNTESVYMNNLAGPSSPSGSIHKNGSQFTSRDLQVPPVIKDDFHDVITEEKPSSDEVDQTLPFQYDQGSLTSQTRHTLLTLHI